MNIILHKTALLTIALSLAALPVAFADEQPELNLAADAQQSQGNPPVIPHIVKPDQDGEGCNVCHRTGVKNTPPTSHPERLNCTSCHVQGEVKKEKKSTRSDKKK